MASVALLAGAAAPGAAGLRAGMARGAGGLEWGRQARARARCLAGRARVAYVSIAAASGNLAFADPRPSARFLLSHTHPHRIASMAKSLRSRSKLAARTAKRRDPNSDYAVAEAARTNALAKRQAERIRGKKLRELEAAEAQAEQGDEAEGECAPRRVRRAVGGCVRCTGGVRLRCLRLASASAREAFPFRLSSFPLTLHAGTMEVDAADGEDAADEADADAEPVKVSTSGTRESRRETWRKAKGWKPKVGKGTSHEGRSKNNGRVKRRR